MARVRLTSALDDLDDWPGHLLQTDSYTVLARNASTFSYRLGGDSPFAGMVVTVTGSGFRWQGGDAVGGNISKIVIRDGSTTVLTIDRLPADTVASSLQVFHDNVFGWSTPNGNQNPNGTAAFSHLLSGNDVIIGTNGDDNRVLPGLQAGHDRFSMKGGDDQVWAGAGNDTINGGAGWDRLTYDLTARSEGDGAWRGIDLTIGSTPGSGTVRDCWGDLDRFSNMESFAGSRFADRFTGGAKREEFLGLAGNDTINGRGDQDTVHYGDDYWSGGTRGIVADLQTSVVNGSIRGQIRDGFGSTDTVINIERVVGTRYADRFVGSTERNEFSGGEGKDYYHGTGGQDGDRLRFDRQFTDANQTGISVDLRKASNQINNDGFGNRETALSIEQVVGSRQADRIIMNNADNVIVGHDGRDTLNGLGGNDTFEFWDRSHIGDNDRIVNFTASGGAGNVDQLYFETGNFNGMSKTLSLVNGNSATEARDQFIFNPANDVLYWDPDGTGAQARIAIATLVGVDALSAANFDLV